jgi:hypothetical protein
MVKRKPIDPRVVGPTTCRKAHFVWPRDLQRTEQRCGRGVVPAVALSAHRASHAEGREVLREVAAGGLAAAIRMKDQAVRAPSAEPGHLQSDLSPIWWTPLSGSALCLFWGDVPEGGVEPLTIVVSFDVGEQVMPRGLPGFVASMVHEFDFQSAEAALRRGIDAPILVKWFSGVKSTVVERRINSRRSRGRRSA